MYFDKPGRGNTDEVLRLVKNRAEDLDIKTIIVASNAGSTALKAAEVCEGKRIVAVSLYTGWKGPDVQLFTEERKRELESKGGVLLTATHIFSGVNRAMQKKFNMYLLGETIAFTLRLFGDGMKVVCEMALMAADAGLVRTNEDVISVAGTAWGADTAVVLKPVNSADFFDLKVKEILCKPRF